MPPNTTNNPIESISEQFQKLDLKALAREKGAYQVYPKISVSIVRFYTFYQYLTQYLLVC